MLLIFHVSGGLAGTVAEFLGDRVGATLQDTSTYQCPWGSAGTADRWCSCRWCAVTGSAGRKVGLHVQACDDPTVQGKLGSLIPSQAVPEEFGQAPHLMNDGLLYLLGAVVGQIQQDREPDGVFDQGADDVPVRRPAD